MSAGALGGQMRRVGARVAVPEWGVTTAAIGVLVVALGLWAVGLARVDLSRMDDYGLISVLPLQVTLSIVLLTFAAAVLLRRETPNGAVLGLYLVALVFMLYAMPVLIEEVPRFVVTWVHDGFAEYIRRTGTVAPDLEARFNWPGFFVLGAFLSQVAGLPDTMAIAGWAPVYFNLLYLLPLALIFRSATSDVRLVWAALWVFELGNWIGQDYFSPQALAYFLYLVILAVFLTWFRVARPRSERVAGWLAGPGRPRELALRVYGAFTPEGTGPRPATPRQAAGLVVAVIVIFAFVAYSHQLTPFFTVAGLLGLLVLNRTSLRSLPFLLGVMAVAWVSYMTVPFLAGHVVSMLREIGQVADTVSTNVTSRIQGSAAHQNVVTFRLAFTLALWGLAAVGALLRFRDGRRDLSLMVLAVAPLPLVGLQAYGGELILRVYLFILPFVAFFATGILFGRPEAAAEDRPARQPPEAAAGPSGLGATGRALSWPRTAVALGVSTVIVFSFLLARYGNERVDALTTAEVQAVDELYRVAQPGSLLVAASNNLPWKFKAFEQYDYVPVTDEVLVGDVSAIAGIMADRQYPEAYLILTRSEGNYAETFTGLPPGAWDKFVSDITLAPEFRLIYRNRDAVIFTRASNTSAGLPGNSR